MRRSSLNAIYDPVYREGKKVVLRERVEDEEELERLAELTKIEEGSPEGIVDHIEYTNLDAYHYSSTEFGIVLQRIQSQGWQYGVGKVISKLVYGEGGTVYLSRRSDKKSIRVLRPNIYCDGFLGLQEFYLYITEEMIRQGLIRRFFIIYVPKNPRYLPPINENRLYLKDDLQDYIAKFVKRTTEVKQQKIIQVTWHPKVLEEINKIDKEFADAVDEDPSLYNLAVQSSWEHVAKLCVCREIANLNGIKMFQGEPTIIVSPQTFEKVYDFFNRTTASLEEGFERIGVVKERPKIREGPYERIKRHIKRALAKGILPTRSYLMQRTGFGREELIEYLADLVAREEVEEKIEQTRTKPRTYYVLTEKNR